MHNETVLNSTLLSFSVAEGWEFLVGELLRYKDALIRTAFAVRSLSLHEIQRRTPTYSYYTVILY